MKERKFADRFTVSRRFDARSGRQTRDVRYTGEYFRFPEGSPSPAARAGRVAPWLGLHWACLLVHLGTAGITGRTLYALMPLLLALFPGVYAVMGGFRLWRCPGRMTVLDREKGVGRLARSCAGAMVLTLAGALGCAVCVLVNHIPVRPAWHEVLLPLGAGISVLQAFRVSKGYLGELVVCK